MCAGVVSDEIDTSLAKVEYLLDLTRDEGRTATR